MAKFMISNSYCGEVVKINCAAEISFDNKSVENSLPQFNKISCKKSLNTKDSLGMEI